VEGEFSTKDRNRRRTFFGWVGSAGAAPAKKLRQVEMERRDEGKITQGWRVFHALCEWFHGPGKSIDMIQYSERARPCQAT